MARWDCGVCSVDLGSRFIGYLCCVAGRVACSGPGLSCLPKAALSARDFGVSGFEKRAQSFGQGANVSVASEIPKRSGLSLQHQVFQV